MSKDCTGNCPSNEECTEGMVHDENELCFCRDCPAGSAVILTGANAGVCKKCTELDCEACGLNTAKDDVECKTCKGNKQLYNIFDTTYNKDVLGCYGKKIFSIKKFLFIFFFLNKDCTAVLPYCFLLKVHNSTTCVCDTCAGQDVGDMKTIFQDTTSSKCKGNFTIFYVFGDILFVFILHSM